MRDKRTLGSRLKIIMAAIGLLGLGLVAALYVWLLADLPPLSTVEVRQVRPTTQIVDRNGRLLYEIVDPAAGKQINLAPDALPQACVQAVLATEDSRFFLHPGVDPIAVGRALWQNVHAGGAIVSGASTLTQQLARTLLMEPDERYEQSIQRKVREAWLALRLELRYTKSELLALYLNQTYFGNWAFGIEAASQVFFAKPADQLSRAECALLAGLIQYPSGYNPLQAPETAKARQLTVLRLMREAGYLSAQEEAAVGAEPLQYRSHLFDIQAPHFVMYIQDLLVRQLGVDRVRAGGLRVVTSLDLALQEDAENVVRRRLDQLNCRLPGVCDDTTDPNRRVDNAAAVILDSRRGEILAMVGSPDYFDASIQGNVNAALTARQPGSAIKPLTYAAALDPHLAAQRSQLPMTAASIIADLPTTFYVTDENGGNVPYVPVNYDRNAHGPVSVRTALANSYNIPAVKTLDRIGVDALRTLASQAGIRTFTRDYGLALTLGGGEVKLLELTAAFGMLDDGQRLEPQAILRIETLTPGEEGAAKQQARLLYSAPRNPGTPQIITPGTAYLITDILADDVARQPAFGSNSVLALPFPAAVKTGTTTDWRDNWTVGYSTARVVGVWVGNADNTPMLDVSGVDGAGPIWHDLMVAAHPVAPPAFPRPADVVDVKICAPSGLLPTPACPRVRVETFIDGTQPTQLDDQFQLVAMDSRTGLPATAATPSDQVREELFWRLPPAFHDWMASHGMASAPPNLPSVRQQDDGDADVEGQNPASKSPAPTSPSLALQLTAPTSNTAYQIHPGVPVERQRIQIGGYADGHQPWTSLRLVVDGDVVQAAANAQQLSAWWVLAPGAHTFRLEGEPTAGAPTIRSADALVVVTPFAQPVDGALSITAASADE